MTINIISADKSFSDDNIYKLYIMYKFVYFSFTLFITLKLCLTFDVIIKSRNMYLIELYYLIC